MTTADGMAPTYGLRAGGLLIASGGLVTLVANSWPLVGLVSVAVSLALATPAVRRERSSRRRVAWVAGAWFVAGVVLVIPAAIFGSGVPLALCAATVAALIGCGVGWGND